MDQASHVSQARALRLLRATFAEPGWPPGTGFLRLVWAIRVALVAAVTLLLVSAPDKPLWDWLDLLVVPAVLAVVGFAFTRSEREATEAATEQRARNDALQAYLDKMSELLVDKNLHGRPDRYDDARVTARARTLAVLRQQGPDGKRTVLLFLREARLINRKGRSRIDGRTYPCIVGLEDADLREANLRDARLIDTKCQEPVSLKGANLGAADLGGADLYRADLRDADLRDASLVGANLRQTALDGTNLEGADLRGADLRGAEGVTDGELEQQACSLVRATMPDGSKHS